LERGKGKKKWKELGGKGTKWDGKGEVPEGMEIEGGKFASLAL